MPFMCVKIIAIYTEERRLNTFVFEKFINCIVLRKLPKNLSE